MMCQACKGRGRLEHKICNGTGRLKGGALSEWNKNKCERCKGTGFVICQACWGSGQVRR
jgi:DnaJ-class molecular chaperone